MIAWALRGGAEVEPPGGQAADGPGLGGEGQQFQDALLVGDIGHPLRHPDPQVDDAVGLEFAGGAPGDDLARRPAAWAAIERIGTRTSLPKAAL